MAVAIVGKYHDFICSDTVNIRLPISPKRKQTVEQMISGEIAHTICDEKKNKDRRITPFRNDERINHAHFGHSTYQGPIRKYLRRLGRNPDDNTEVAIIRPVHNEPLSAQEIYNIVLASDFVLEDFPKLALLKMIADDLWWNHYQVDNIYALGKRSLWKDEHGNVWAPYFRTPAQDRGFQLRQLNTECFLSEDCFLVRPRMDERIECLLSFFDFRLIPYPLVT